MRAHAYDNIHVRRLRAFFAFRTSPGMSTRQCHLRPQERRRVHSAGHCPVGAAPERRFPPSGGFGARLRWALRFAASVDSHNI